MNYGFAPEYESDQDGGPDLLDAVEALSETCLGYGGIVGVVDAYEPYEHVVVLIDGDPSEALANLPEEMFGFPVAIEESAPIEAQYVTGSDACSSRAFSGIAADQVTHVLTRLQEQGGTVWGSNPWDVDVGHHGVKLHGHFDHGSGTLHIAVAEKNFYVTCNQVWEKIDPLVARAGGTLVGRTTVGWSQPPHPIEFIPSVDPRDSHKQQARSVLYDYFHDNDVRSWVDDGSVKAAFGVKKKEDYDPVQLIAAYENKSHPVWRSKAQAPGLSGAVSQAMGQATWKAMHAAVEKAIAKRLKLGPLPESNYDSDPVVIYYYDNDYMKKITYPRIDIPDALHPDDKSWWKHGGIGTYQSTDLAQIAKERAKPGFPGGGGWGNEGFDWDKDIAGNIQMIVAGIMEVVGAVVQIIPGVGTAVGTALIIGGAIVASIAGAIDDAFQGKDNAGALAGIAKGLMAAASSGLKAETGVSIPPEAMKALSGTVDMVAQDVAVGQKKRLSYSELWDGIAAKAKQYGKLGDEEAHAIAVILGENAAGHLFIQGHTVGKYATMKQIEAISKIVQGFSVFVKDPKALNIFLLGAGVGHLTAHQNDAKPPILKQSVSRTSGAWADDGSTLGQPMFTGARTAKDDLDAFVHWRLKPRYNLHKHAEEMIVGATYDARVARAQYLLNELWGFVPAEVGHYLYVDGLLGDATRKLLKSFQVSYGVGPGDGSVTEDTLAMLESEVVEKHAMQQRASTLHATHGYFAGQSSLPPPPPPPDWGPLSRGCPQGTWFDPLNGNCRPMSAQPLPSLPTPPIPSAVRGEWNWDFNPVESIESSYGVAGEWNWDFMPVYEEES